MHAVDARLAEFGEGIFNDLPCAVAALVFRMMRLSFEGGWIVGGKIDLTFRRPVGVHDFCVAKGTVVEKLPEADGKTRVVCEVSVETEKGVQAIVGKCSGVVG